MGREQGKGNQEVKKTFEGALMVKTKKGIITSVHNMGSMWAFDVAESFKSGKPAGEITRITGDWRPMRDGLDSAFDISSPNFPYVSNKKIYENVVGQMIEYTPDEIFGASSWRPLGERAFKMVSDAKGKLKIKKVL